MDQEVKKEEYVDITQRLAELQELEDTPNPELNIKIQEIIEKAKPPVDLYGDEGILKYQISEGTQQVQNNQQIYAHFCLYKEDGTRMGLD